MAPEYEPRGKAVLHFQLVEACQRGKVDTARSLLKSGASPNWEMPDHARNGDDDPRAGPAPVTAIHWGRVDVLRMLLDERPQLLKSFGGRMLAAALTDRAVKPDGARAQILKLLIERKIDVNLTVDYNQRTPLMLAAMKGDVESVRILLLAGADAKRRDEQGKTALVLAREAKSPAPGHEEVIKQLEPVTK